MMMQTVAFNAFYEAGIKKRALYAYDYYGLLKTPLKTGTLEGDI